MCDSNESREISLFSEKIMIFKKNLFALMIYEYISFDKSFGFICFNESRACNVGPLFVVCIWFASV